MRTFFDGPFENSLFSGLRWQKRTALIVVPHQDDELNLTGATICNLLEHHIRVRVLFCTNSDRFEPGALRIQEGIASCRNLGVPEEDIIFLGYCNTLRLRPDLNFYNGDRDDLPVTSTRGLTETYCLPDKPEFCFKQHQVHHTYTKHNFRSDIQEVIQTYLPEVIFAVDFDRHPDHRSLSFIFEEALANILSRAGNTYQPEVYKGFAYNGSFLGQRDFYSSLNLRGEVPAEGSFSNNLAFDTDYPPYDWSQRVRLPVPRRVLSRTLNGSFLYPAIRAHFSQGMLHNAKRVLNSDQVFWRRRTDSLSYQAKITVSSGNGAGLNNFKLADCPDVLALPALLKGGTWIPDSGDTQKEARLDFAAPQPVSRVVLYGNADLENRVLAGTITLSNGFALDFGPLREGAKATVFDFPPQLDLTWVKVKLRQTQGKEAGLNEIEVYAQAEPPTLLNYLKLMVDGTFAYDYWLQGGQRFVRLQLYTCGPGGVKIYEKELPSAYTLKKVSGSDYELKGLEITLGPACRKAVIRVECMAEPEVYDQIVLRPVSPLQLTHLKLVQGVDVVWNRLEHVVKNKYYKLFIKEKNRE